MKYIITLFFFVTSCHLFGQQSVVYGDLIKVWTQAKIDINGKVVQTEINRSGWCHLIMNADTTVIFEGPPNCGFGYQRLGKWKLNTVDSMITFSFSKKIGYVNVSDFTFINESETYKINKLTQNELIISRIFDGKVSKIAFLKSSVHHIVH